MLNIKLTVGGVELAGTLDDSDLTQKVIELLPVQGHGETWGKEVYFPIELKVGNIAPVTEVRAGDIAYWPDGPDVCLFFGPTPKSTGEAPVTPSPVTVIGRFEFGPEDFDRIERRRSGIFVRIERGKTAG